ncbi:hypothetical protein VPH35_138338 [Triticum aestivum]
MADPGADPAVLQIVPCPDCGRNVVTYVGAARAERRPAILQVPESQPIGGWMRFLQMGGSLRGPSCHSTSSGGKSVLVRCRAGRRLELKLCRRRRFITCSRTERRRCRRLHPWQVRWQDTCWRRLQSPVVRVASSPMLHP